ncbi:MAG TPA: N-acetyltransferase [Polyangiaceae bacterium]|nr:N-acetyltransferase [Polyangiaceae bacterium]
MAHVRHEGPADEAGVRTLNELAFGRTEEANLVDALRRNGGIVLSLVAFRDERIVGHVVFSAVKVETTSGHVVEGVALGPMAVLPELQRTSIGGHLLRLGLAQLSTDGHRFVVVLGHPDYYARFGFEPASSRGLRWAREGHDPSFLAKELAPGGLHGVDGLVRYRPEFDAL